jgi:AbrB family looped-hinge helix DNA binding protein
MIITIQGGAVVLPGEVRELFGLRGGSTLAVDTSEGGIIFRPLAEDDIEIYSSERRAEFVLHNAVNDEDYAQAVEEVRRMGVEPESIPHTRPSD